MLSRIACRCCPAERLKRRKYLINDKNYSQSVVTFKPFSPDKYLFIMTLTVGIEQCKKNEPI